MTLTEFYAARLDEREAAAKAAKPGGWTADHHWERGWRVLDGSPESATLVAWSPGPALAENAQQSRATADHIAVNDPAAVLADIEGKRKILAAYEAALADEAVGLPMPSARPGLEYAVIALATAFADHPDYPLNRQGQAP